MLTTLSFEFFPQLGDIDAEIKQVVAQLAAQVPKAEP